MLPECNDFKTLLCRSLQMPRVKDILNQVLIFSLGETPLSTFLYGPCICCLELLPFFYYAPCHTEIIIEEHICPP